MSTIMTSHHSWASTSAIRKMALVITIGEPVSDFNLHNLCGWPSAHPHALILLLHFSFKYTRYLRAHFLCSSLNLFTALGMMVFIWISCLISVTLH
jgi:hypothetical protein